MPSLDISSKLQGPAELYQILSHRIFPQNPADFGDAALSSGQHWRERTQLSPALAIAQVLQQQNSLLAVLPTSEDIRQVADDLRALGLQALVFPSWGSSLYKGIRSQNRIFTERSTVLAKILFWQQAAQKTQPLIVLSSLRALAQVLPPPREFEKSIVQLQIGRDLEPSQLADQLSHYGYFQVPRVSLPGEFALRGEVLDFHPPLATTESDQSSGCGIRVMFGFDEVEMLKVFDIGSQISRCSIEQFPLFPLKEVLWEEAQQQTLRNCLEQILLEAQPADFALAEERDWDEFWCQQQEGIEALLSRLEQQQELPGEELLFPFASSQAAGLPDYLGANCPLLFWGAQRIEQQEERYLQELESLYQQSLIPFQTQEGKSLFPELVQRKLLQPKAFAVNLNVLRHSSKKSITLEEFEGNAWPLDLEPALQYHGNLNRFSEDLQRWLEEDYFVAIGCSSTAQAQRILHILKDYEEHLHFFPYELGQGVIFPRQKLALLQEWEILGHRAAGHSRPSATRKKDERITRRLEQSEVISSFIELKEGDLVVHLQHGVGRFKGIERISTARMERDYLAIEYSEGNTLFVPIEQVNMVQRYIGSEGLRLDRIGGKAWQERKAKTQQAVEDLAERLLRLYARRTTTDGFCYPDDDELQEEFEADFPYEPTPDQLRSVEEIKQDLQNSKPMDRLLCGDVGFGKTEVAMRAGFKVASNGRQVIVLCPTTILAEQHYQNFCKRFSRFPLRIAMLSRFVGRKEQKAILTSLEKGEVDILIGTHRILAKDIHLQNLGLIVIDEEQRFGVKHKERLKLLKTSVDCLSMSATPIPRTLHMSLVQIRDISMLSIAPRNRHPIETFVREFDPQSIAAAIRNELSRGGQAFYLHNRIDSLEETLSFIRELVPEALIEMAHGQMESKELEDIMYRFVHGSFNVLLATTIIENGIDIPNVNTIIIDRADRYGIGQLYQLRGRVGRSDQLAYAYLFYPDRSGLSDLALKRLQIISDFTELGSGFKVAMKDLEVRGAGNLLGPEQSGNIAAVGFEMYSSMLAQAMQKRKYQMGQAGGDLPPEELKEDILLELDYSGFIPDTYIPDATEKIDLYKRISLIDSAEFLADFYEELFDRFGTPPEEVNSLLSLAEIRIICRQVGIIFLKERQNQVELQFSKLRPLPLEIIMQQIRHSPEIFRIDSKNSDALLIDLAAFMQNEMRTKQTQKSKQAKHSRNAQYLGSAAVDKHEPATPSELLQKTLALRKVLSSFQQ